MAEITLPEPDVVDIYSLGFDKTLNKALSQPINNEAASIVYDPISGAIQGQQISSGGVLGGWTITPTALFAGTGSTRVGLDITQTSGDDVRIFAGGDPPNSALFKVTEAGAITGTNVAFTGGTIGGFTIGATTISSGNLTLTSGNAGGGAGIFAQNIFSTIFEAAGRFVSSSGGSGSSTFDSTGLTITTGATGTSYNETYPSFSGTAYDYTLRTSFFSINAFVQTQGTDRHCIFGPGFLTTSGLAITYTGKHYGFKLNRAASVSTNSATNADGTTEKATSFVVTETTRALYTAQKNGTTNIEYYVDGVLVVTHTANLPATDNDTPLYMAISNISAASSSQLNFMNYTFCQTAH